MGGMSTLRTARERARAEISREILDEAGRQLATDGAAALSLRAVARALGMASSALYRYFPSRDELLTALIIEAYDALGAQAERAVAAEDPRQPGDRWRAACEVVRQWATDNPHQYALVYGSPVPGYQAPERTVGPASRITLVLTGILRDAWVDGMLDPPPGPPVDPAWVPEATRISQLVMPGVPPEAVARALLAWTQLFGLVSFELFGHLVGAVEQTGVLFETAVRQMGAFVGLPAPRGHAGSRSPAGTAGPGRLV
jgi:AcrR family transcriptional regulator